MSDYDDLVRRLRQNEETRPRRLDEGSHVGRGEQALAADAIERLQADLAASNADAERLADRLRIHRGQPHQRMCDGWEWQDGDALAAHRARLGGDT